jgi:cation:H+ antiporter
VLGALLQGGGGPIQSVAIFVLAAAVVWWAGSRLATLADRFAKARGLSGALVGLLLLGGITSLPEVATSATAAIGGSGDLAANNLIGGVALQLMALVLVDALVGRRALTSTPPRPDVLAYAAMNVLLLMIVAGAAAAGDVEILGSGVGAGALLVALAYGVCLSSARVIGRGATWRPASGADADEDEQGDSRPDAGAAGPLTLQIGLVALVILAGGYFLTRSAESLAELSGLGESFFGAVFLGGATSLPEVSSAIAAVRLGRPQMAVGDVLGGNMFNLSLILLVDVLYRQGPILADVGPFSVVAACLAALLCAVLLIGLVERRDRTVLRIGYDSAVMLVLYAGGLLALYHLRDSAG